MSDKSKAYYVAGTKQAAKGHRMEKGRSGDYIRGYAEEFQTMMLERRK